VPVLNGLSQKTAGDVKSPVFRGFCLGVERFFGAGAIGSGSSYMSNCGSQCIEAVHEAFKSIASKLAPTGFNGVYALANTENPLWERACSR
jgi:hypothetical protein